MQEVNFFWSGPRFYFLESLVIKSHIMAGHKPIIWLQGDEPATRFWDDILDKVQLKNANEIFDTTEFIKQGGNFRTASDLWRYNLLYKQGGLYCDLDAFAIKKFPDDEWIVCSGEPVNNLLSIGVLKAPPGHPLFLECINRIGKNWGNVKSFSEAYKIYFGNYNPTHPNEWFYPYDYRNFMNIYKNVEIPKNSYSIHFYSGYLEGYSRRNKTLLKKLLIARGNNIISELDEKWCEKHPDKLLGKLWNYISENDYQRNLKLAY